MTKFVWFIFIMWASVLVLLLCCGSSAVFPVNAEKSEQIKFLVNVLGIEETPELDLKIMSGGITNSIYRFDTPSRQYIVRIYGRNTELIINRKKELENIRKINLIEIFATFDNGFIVTFQKGSPVDLDMMSSSYISDKIATVFASFHKQSFELEPESNEIFEKIDNFIDGLNESPSINTTEMRQRALEFKQNVTELMRGAPVLLCHNDLLAGNVIWDRDSETVSIIDYEYSAWTWPQFDIANHFFEWCGFECDLKRFPSVDQQKRFLRIYLATLYDKPASEETVDLWQHQVTELVGLSNMFWGYWAYFQAQNSEVDFPYERYAQIRTGLVALKFPLAAGHEMLGAPLVSFGNDEL